ncbi:hypothetical protein [Microbacterium sp. NC79]|uniref:hypothetical protein n=1 Tax=Microbacterium sp. NC79 TaxID=2851009 RepID=UPI001C2C4758|nr:hypothetical protein [Microbacterium sp. NC79]MBV0894012.1 hypothetical protein [Microbacterium sp. NC79]
MQRQGGTMRKILAALVIVSAMALGGCAQQTPPSGTTITEMTHSQSKAVPNFDSSEQVEKDPARLAEFQALLEGHAGESTDDRSDGCTGGTTTDLSWVWSDRTTDTLSTYRCGQDAPDFVVELTELIASWR